MVLSRSLTAPPTPIQKLRLDTPRAIAALIDRSLARNVAERIPSGSAVVEAINDFEGRPTTPSQPMAISGHTEALDDSVRGAPASLPALPAKRNRFPVWMGAGTAILALTVAAGYFVRQGAGTGDSATTLASHMSRDSVANQFYLRGRTLTARRTQASLITALESFQGAIQRDSSFALAWAGLSRAAVFMAQRGFTPPGVSADSLVAIAINASEHALDLDSANAEIWVVRSRAIFAADPTDATPKIAALNNAIDIDPDNSDAWSDLALAKEERLDAREAEQDWQKAISLNPKNFTALAFFALHYMWAKQPARGVPLIDSAISIDPTYILGREAAGNLLVDLGQLDKAERQFLAYLRITSGREQVNALTGLVRVEVARGNPESARSYLKRAVALADSIHPTKHESPLIGAAFAAVGDTAAAIRWISRYEPRADLHFQLHLKRDPALKWLHGPRGKGLLAPDPQ
jgi:Tfp pilus assembly protein PilF